MSKLPQLRIAVKKGDVYRIPRNGKPARLVRATRVLTGEPQRPIALLVPVSSSGAQKGRKRLVVARNDLGQPTRTVPAHVPHHLTWRDAAWRAPESWELVES